MNQLKSINAVLCVIICLSTPSCSENDSQVDDEMTFTYLDVYDNPEEGGVKDYSVVKAGATYHIFHISDPRIGWQNRGEKAFVHATTNDFVTWTRHERIELKDPSWSGTNVWAPHVFEEAGTYYMFYTGVEWSSETGGTSMNFQRIGLATSTDLFDWTLYNGNGLVLDGPWHDQYDWSVFGTPNESWKNDCRDPFVYHDGDEYVMLNSIRTPSGQMAIALAKSTDLLNWSWSHHLPVTVGDVSESANMVKVDSTYYVIWTSSWDGEIQIASATDIDGPYVLETSEGLYGYANETMNHNGRLFYGAIVGDFALQISELTIDVGGSPVATTKWTGPAVER